MDQASGININFARGADWDYPVAHAVIDPRAMPITIGVSGMMFGANYFRLENSTGSAISLGIDLISDESNISWDISTAEGSQVVSSFTVPEQSSTILIVTAMPTGQVYSGDFTFEPRNGELTLSAP